jgi:hypothetical protein
MNPERMSSSTKVRIIYNQESYDASTIKNSPSIFLCGPSPRSGKQGTYREAFLRELDQQLIEESKLSPTATESKMEASDSRWSEILVFHPEYRPGTKTTAEDDYSQCYKWELQAMEASKCLVFGFATTPEMPGLCTRVEFGLACGSKKTSVAFFPADAWRVTYARNLCEHFHIPTSETLRDCVRKTLDILKAQP